MSRTNRQDYLYDNCVVHARMQFNNKDYRFNSDKHFKMWQKIALRYLKKYPSIKITGYIWMNSHCHLTIEVGSAADFSKFMHDMTWRFAITYNKTHKRNGHLFKERFKCSVIDSDRYEKIVKRYIYRNQIRAGMVKHVKHTKWSSYHYYAYGKKDPLITPFRNFSNFGLNHKIRMIEFRKFVETLMDHEEQELKILLQFPNMKRIKRKRTRYDYT
ncbi:transposase [bacterium]|nr:transposase [bacterium]